MKFKFFISVFVLSLNFCLCFAGYNVIDLGNTQVLALNNLGEIVGHDNVGAYIWDTDSGKRYLATTLIGKTWALDVNDRSQVLGVNQSGLSWIYDKGATRYLSQGGTLINNHSVICTKNEKDINDLGDTVGQIHTGARGSQRASLNGREILPVYSMAYGINNQKQIVGWMGVYHFGNIDCKIDVKNIQLQAGSSIWIKIPEGVEIYNTPVHAFLWEDHTFIDLGTLGGLISESLAVNDLGQVVGFSATNEMRNIRIGSAIVNINVCHAFIWENNVMKDLNSLIDDNTLELKCAISINNRGQILAYALKQNMLHAVLLNPAE